MQVFFFMSLPQDTLVDGLKNSIRGAINNEIEIPRNFDSVSLCDTNTIMYW